MQEKISNTNGDIYFSHKNVFKSTGISLKNIFDIMITFFKFENRLPKSVEANLEAPVFDGKAPEPVEETPEVAAARAEFLKTFEEVQTSRTKRESDPAIVYGYNGALPFYTSRYTQDPTIGPQNNESLF